MSHLWTDNEDAFIPETGSLRVQAENSSAFGEFLTVSRTPIIELNSSFGTSAIRDVVTLTGTGSKDDINGTLGTGEISLSTGATASSTAALESAEVARYIPGYAAEAGLGVRIPSLPTGDQVARWGVRSPLNGDGLWFQYDADGLAVVRSRDGVETVIQQADFNRDQLDGTGPSGVDIDLSSGFIFQIDYTWYAFGGIRYSVIAGIPGFFQRPIAGHFFRPSSYTGTSIRSPSLRIFAEVDNGTTASDLTMFIGGRQYSIVGNYVPKYRYTGQARGAAAVSTTARPLVSFRFKSLFLDRSVKLEAFDLLNNGNAAVTPEIRIGGTLTGASWITPTNYTAGETALEADISATAISGGTVIYAGTIVGAAKDGGGALSNVDLDIPEEQVVTLCARSFSGSQDCISGLRLREEWVLVFALGADMIARAMSSLGGSLGGFI